MADSTTTQDPELKDAEQGQVGDNQQNGKPNSNEVKIREPFEIGGVLYIIYDIEEDKKGKRTANWKIREGSQVDISGSGLEIYDQINLHIAGGVYFQKNIDRQAGGRLLGFTVSDEIKDLFAEGAEIELEFVSNANPTNNRYLKQKFHYKGESAEEKAEAKKKLAEEQELKQAKAGDKARPGAVSEIINRTIGGAAEAFGQGLAGKPNVPASTLQGSSVGTKATSQGGVAGGSVNDDIDDDQNFGAEFEQQATADIASTLAQSSVGAEVVSEGSTVQGSTAGTQTISSGGTVTGTQAVSSGGTIKTSAEVSAGGTATAQQQVQTGGTVTGRESASVSGTTGGTASAKISQTVSGTVNGGGTATVAQNISGGATGNITQKTQDQAALVDSNVSGNVSTQATTESKISSTGQAQSKAEGHENISTESKTSAEPNVGSKDSEKEKVAAEVKQTATGQEKKAENQSSPKPPTTPAPGKGKVDGVEKKPETEAPEKPSAQKKPVSAKAPTSPPQLGGLSGTLNRFEANKAALGSLLGGGASGKQPSATKKQSGSGQNILSNAPQRAPGEKDKAGDAEKEKSDGKIAEEKEEKPLASPMGSPLPQEDMEAGDSQELPEKQDGTTPPGKEKSEQEENQERQTAGEQTEPEAEQEQEGNQQPPIIQKPAVPQALGAVELAEAEKLANTTVNAYLQGLATVIWASALPTFGLSILFGAIAGDVLWLLKDWAIKKALGKVPLPKKFRNANLKDFHINFNLAIKSQIAAWNAIIILAVALVFIFIFTILWGICTSVITYPVREMGLGPVCEVIEKSSLGQGLDNFKSTGSFSASYNVPGTLTGTAQWTDQINSSAQKWNIDACILRVVVQKESGGQEKVIGCDCAANGHPEYCPDKRKTYSSDYQFNWNQCSYGIGLTQWTIYPKGGSGYRAWQDANTPSRNLYSSWYGVTDLLDGKTSLDLTAKAFSANLGKANGDVSAAFAAYVGASNVQNRLVADRMALYGICKQGSQFGGGASGGAGATDTFPAPTGSPGVNISSFVKPWNGPDPYPAVDWGNLDPNIDPQIKTKLNELQVALNGLSQDWLQLGRGSLQPRQVYRPQAYTDHYRSIWEINAISKGKDNTAGYRCDEVSHLDPVEVKKLSLAQIQSLQVEFNRHQVDGPTPAGCVSDHSSGIALDIDSPNGSLYSGSLYVSLMQEAQKFGLCHNIAGDQPHYSLTKYLPAGTDCFQK